MCVMVSQAEYLMSVKDDPKLTVLDGWVPDVKIVTVTKLLVFFSSGFLWFMNSFLCFITFIGFGDFSVMIH